MKFFTKEVKIAITAIVAVVLLFFTINFLKGRNVFKTRNIYYVEFANTAGIVETNVVYANGYPVGSVVSLNFDYKNMNRVIVGIDLNENMKIPKGSRAELETNLMGGVTMNLILGPNPTDLLAQGDTIKGGLHLGLMDKGEELVPDVARLLPKLDSILANINALSANPALSQTIENAGNASANLNKSTILLNQMLQGEIGNLAQSLKASGANVQAFTDNLAKINVNSSVQDVNRMLSDLNVVSADLKTISSNVSGFTGDLGELSKNLQHLLTNVNTLSSSLDNTINDLNRQLNSKDNTAGMLLNDRQLYDNLNATASSLNATAKSADSLLTDLKAHPKRYVHFSVFGRKDKK